MSTKTQTKQTISHNTMSGPTTFGDDSTSIQSNIHIHLHFPNETQTKPQTTKKRRKNKKRTRSDTNDSNNVPSKKRRCNNKSNAKNAHKHKTIKGSDINNKSKTSSTTTKHK
eukprot:495887_1